MTGKTIRQFLFVFMCTAGSVTSHGQSLDFQWVHPVGVSDQSHNGSVRDGVVDKDGNVFVVGNMSASAVFNGATGPISLSTSGRGWYLAKYSSSGVCLWVRQLSPAGSGFGEGASVKLDTFGYAYVTGFFSGTFDYEVDGVPQSVTSEGEDVLVARIDPQGHFRWLRKFGSSGGDGGTALAVDDTANVYIGGTFSNTVDFNAAGGGEERTANGTSRDVFLMKLDSSGAFRWVSTVTGANTESVRGIAVDHQGSLLATGAYARTVDFSGGLSLPGAVHTPLHTIDNIYVLKLAHTGAFSWVKTMVSAIPHGSSTGMSVVVDGIGDVYTSGYFVGKVDFNPGLAALEFNTSSTTNRNIFISKLDGSGNFIQARNIGAASQDEGRKLALGADTSLYVTGVFRGTVDFDPSSDTYNLTSDGAKLDVFILKLNRSLDFIWGNRMGGANDDEGFSVTVDSDDNVYTFGTFRGEAEFNFTSGPSAQLTAPANGNGFLHKVRQFVCQPTGSSLNISGCDTVVLNGTEYTVSGSYVQKLQNAAGCDSILSLDVTVHRSVTGSTITHTACDSFIFEQTKYDRTGSYPVLLTTVSGCDSTVVLNLTVHNSVSEVVYEDVCASYTIGGVTYTEGGSYTHRFQTDEGCDSTVLLHLSVLNTSDTVSAEVCSEYVTAAETYTESGVYTQMFINAEGCDSLLVYDLDIRQVDVSVSRSGITLIADQEAAVYQWLRCGAEQTPVAGAEGKEFRPDADGEYAVAVSWGGCTDTSDCYRVSGIPSSVAQLEPGQFRVYPNPADDRIQILLPDGFRTPDVRILDITGRVLRTFAADAHIPVMVDISGFQPGVYFVELSGHGQVRRAAWVKK